MVWKTFTFTAYAAICSTVASFPSFVAAISATPARSVKSPSRALPGDPFSPLASFIARYVCVAPTMAPHFVWPSTITRREPSLPVQNSKLPTMEPSAWVQVLPALRRTNISPGMASKTVSIGARESAQPMIAVCGACPDLTRAVFIFEFAATLAGVPATNRSLPSLSMSRAFSGETDASSPVRTPWMPRLAAPALLIPSIDGGMAAEASLKSSACFGDRPRNCTKPVAKSYTPPWISTSPAFTASRRPREYCSRKFIVWNTFTFTAWAATKSSSAMGPMSYSACSATSPKPSSRPSSALWDSAACFLRAK
mmetsp:Transcript_16016/g.37838  ORF Transcript_16016/g.37838 Transcript_16016/m.37838 type:complete len:310 (+) Transcript_16016:1241-2170(+)